MSKGEQTLSRKMAGGAIWMLSARMLMRASGLINVMILARLLPPADFGVVGLTVALIGAFEAMSDLSMSAAIVRHPNPQKKHYDTAFTISVLRGLLIGGLALLAAEPLADFYGDERLVYVAWALAAQAVITGFTNIGTADFQREFTFNKDFAFLAARKLGGSAASIGFALTIWPDYRALVAGLILGSVASVAASFYLHPMRPRFSVKAFKELFGFSKWMLATNLLDFAHRRCDALILGKTLGLTSLGIHALAMELANLVANDFAQPLRRATMPGFAKLQSNLKELRHQFATAYSASMVFAVPFALGVALVAEPAIRLAFGPDWAAAAAPLRILCIYGLCGASVQFCWPLLVSMGEPRRFAPLQIIALIVGAPLIWWASVEFGLIGAAWAMSAMGGFYALLVMRAALSLCDGDPLQVLDWAPRVLGAGLAMALAVRFMQAMLPYDGGAASASLQLFVSIVVGAITYPVALWIFWRLAGRPESSESRIIAMAQGFIPARLRKV